MKVTKLFLIHLLMVLPSFVFGRESADVSPFAIVEEASVGNGGGAWVCYNNDEDKTVRWATLVDLYEGREEFKLTIPQETPDKNYEEIIELKKLHLEEASREFLEILNPYIEKVLISRIAVNSDLEVVDDLLYRIRPSERECRGGTIRYVQLANYTQYGKILIQNHLWSDSHFSPTDQAALIFHEAIYVYLREIRGDKDSTRTREMVAYLFSDLNDDLLKEKIEKLIGVFSPPPSSPPIEMQFVKIPAGSFKMGDNEHVSERPIHTVIITKDFEIQTTEVTQRQWFEIMKYNPSYFKGGEQDRNKLGNYPDYPVENIMWDQVQTFIVKLNKKNDGYHYRLPTEAEWEYAARGGTKTPYSFEEGEDLSEYGWYQNNSGDQTHRVAGLKPNPFGLYDVHGNVDEWVMDWYGSYPDGELTDPKGPQSGSYRVVRGGNWLRLSYYLRSAARIMGYTDQASKWVGFRLVRVPTQLTEVDARTDGKLAFTLPFYNAKWMYQFQINTP